MTYDIRSSTDFVDSTTFDQQHPLQDPLPEPPPVSNDLEKMIEDVEENLASLVSEAHIKTCHLTAADIATLMDRAQHDIPRQITLYQHKVRVPSLKQLSLPVLRCLSA